MNIVVHRVEIHIGTTDLSPLTMELQKMTEALDRLRADVAAEDTIIDSAVTMITGFASQIREAVSTAVAASLAAGTDSPDVSALTDLANDIEGKSAALAAAVAANTTPPPSAPAAGPAATGTDPVKVVGTDTGLVVAPNAGATAFDPPIPGTPGPFDGAPIPEAPDSPAPATDAAAQPTGETATNVANPPSDSTIANGMVDATSGVDQHGTVTDLGGNATAGTPGTASEVPAA